MSALNNTLLSDENTATQFYQQRFSEGYMEDWPDEKKRRITEVIRSLELPPLGEALDFGCGNGVLTELLRLSLPAGWKVYGIDISQTAIENAKKHYPSCSFHTHDDPLVSGKNFDFLFTHHVLEHVCDLQATINQISGYLKSNAAMLHILPCGNPGSFEHQVCLLRKDGINFELNNRFFFEDEGHLRRLTSAELCKLVQEVGFTLEREYYYCHYFGAIDWITQAGPDFIRMFTNPSSAKNYPAKLKLIKLYYKLLFIGVLRSTAGELENYISSRRESSPNKQLRQILPTLLYPVAKAIDFYWKTQSRMEWQKKRNIPMGSEMFLFFKR